MFYRRGEGPTVRPNRQRFQQAVTRAVAELGGDREAARRSGVSKSVWYDAKSGRALPDNRTTWPRMLQALAGLPVARTRIDDWQGLYDAARAEAGRPSDQGQPPAATAARVPRQLPPGVAHFTARRDELARLRTLRPGIDTVTVPMAVVVGPPGVGKTALALTWAHQVGRRFPDGVLYADLNGWGPGEPVAAEEVLPGWLHALGLELAALPDDLASRSALLRTTLTGRRLLVLLDNAGSEEQIRPLLPGSSTCAVLVTSRRDLPGLAVRLDATVRLQRLTTDESVALMRSMVSGRVDQEPGAASALAELCAGLPLALRVVGVNAGARPEVSLAQLVEELSADADRLDRLDADDPRSDPRTVFSWSYHQLAPETAAVFRRLALFPGRTFDERIAAAVGDCPPRTAGRHLRALTRAHLVQARGGARFELHDLLRLYATELVVPNEALAARGRLFTYLLHATHRADERVVPQRYRPPLSGESPVPVDFRDYREALSWLDNECAGIVALCRQDLPELDPLRWRLAFHLRGFFFLTKRIHEWVSSHEAALAAAVRAGDRLGEAMTRNNLGIARHEQGVDDEALRHYEAAQRLFAEEADWHGVSNALAHRAAILRRRGDFEQAFRLNAEALDFYRRAGSRRNIAITLRGIALVEISLGRPEVARRHLREALGICADLGMSMDLARTQNTLGTLLRQAGEYAAAEEAHRAAIEAGLDCGSRYEEAVARYGLGSVALVGGHPGRAEARWRDALAVFEAIGSPKAADVRADLERLINGRDVPRSTRE